MPSTMPRDVTTPAARPADSELPLAVLVRPYRRRWRLVLATLGVAWLGAAAALFIPQREYTASVMLAAVPNARTSALSGGLSAILGSAQLGGVQSTPYFIAKLILLRSVIMQVASERVTDARGGTVIERVLEERPPIKLGRVEPAMRKAVTAEVDKQTGLITVGTTLPDSAVARFITRRLTESASATFVRVSRAQASSQRTAQAERVDSAQRQLRRAEERSRGFASSNRSFTLFSEASVVRRELEREVNNAQTVYSQARADYETAVARELEETPAVVVVDSIPNRLLPDPRHAPLKLVLASVLALLVVTLVLWSQREFQDPSRASLTEATDGSLRVERPMSERVASGD
jgi:uncharacterized protein involved in exopolysaccharide biosynthesis